MGQENQRREFLKKAALAGAGAALGGGMALQSATVNAQELRHAIQSRGLAATDSTGILREWTFPRRPLGDNDILIDIKYSGICHSDIHQERGHWQPQQYPQVPGHEIAGIVAAVGKKVTKFRVGDKAGVGCMVDSCMECYSCTHGEEHLCERNETVYTYGSPQQSSPTGISQGGYSSNIVVRDHFAIRIPDSIDLQHAAPLLCAGITTYSPLMRSNFKPGDKVGVVGIGGLGHLAVKLAVSKGAEVYAFTTSASKVQDILGFGAREVIVVDTLDKLLPYNGQMDYVISTIPYDFDIASYASLAKPFKEFTQVGMPIRGQLSVNNFLMIRNRVNLNGSLIGGIAETQEVMDYCAKNGIHPQIQIIDAGEVNDAWNKVVNKDARYRYVIDASTI
ncbi:NAD(P)-dependent alcohol dehydrogenase [Vibrio mangrovi]|uniref:NAD(P)-dependent alcohol dehydrogenase n=1 Tax=Vibrio mangrovi TaxID=474394 RepID=A0A1Y6IQB6_9VIBR|nr:NAD(P)-dependent alcohol dehydrogenase [Vibrio mangrovi]MDW6004212.1 NAD(P)-dependent alcohol dehydrogenase [Vibrio mangrovi]SMR98990.1 NADP-dependent alcohol dehydrogenase C 2 [Vibrio mangrovi]